jgi:beta-glucosidase
VLLCTALATAVGLGSAAAADAADEFACEPDGWPAPALPPTQHAEADATAAHILARLSLEEKVAQMIQADIASITPGELAQYKLGSILAGGNAAPGGNVRSTPRAWLDMVTAYRNAGRAAPRAAGPAGTSEAAPPVPILFGIDAVHGNAKIIGATIFPHNVALGAAGDAELVRRIGAATAEEVGTIGVNWTFAPTVAVARDVRWGRAYESYSEDPTLVARFAAAMVSGLQGNVDAPGFPAPGATLSSVKHFLGDGGTEGGRDQGENEAPLAILRDVHARGYESAIGAGAMIVMASYNSWRGVKLHADHCLLTRVLRERLGFSGFVVGDWNAHEQIPGCTKWNCPTAGIDMLMAPDGWKGLYESTLSAVRAGVIPEARIDDAVSRILRVKAIAGLFDPDARRQTGVAAHFELLGSARHRQLARDAVRRSLVLLKNAHGSLPLDPRGRYVVVGAAADDIRTQAGGWTIDWQGDHNTNADFPGATSIYAGIAAAVRAAGGEAHLDTDGSARIDPEHKPTAALFVYGEGPYAEFEGDRETLEFQPQDREQLARMRRLHAAGIPVISIFLSGRPLWVNPQLNASDAFVAAWLPGSEAEGVADVLFRAADGSMPYDFAGTLAFSWPATALPVRFSASGAATGALFARGYGLHYGAQDSARGDETSAQGARADARLSEDPGVKAPEGELLRGAHVLAPWSVFVSDSSAEVRLTTANQESPAAVLEVRKTRLHGTGALLATWQPGRSAVLRFSGRPADLRDRSAAGARLVFRVRVLESPTGTVRLGMRCAPPYVRDGQPNASDAAAADCGVKGGAMRDVTASLRALPVGVARTFTLPLACLSAAGADLADVEAPFAIETSGRLRLALDAVSLAPSPAPESVKSAVRVKQTTSACEDAP